MLPHQDNIVLVGRKVRGAVVCYDCETPEEMLMAGVFLLSGRCEPGLACSRCGRELDPSAS